MDSQRDFHSRELTRRLPERVGQLYYSHGLFCSSHPVAVLGFAIFIILLCCYPLLNLPMPGNVPQQLMGNVSSPSGNSSDTVLPQWFTGQPMAYVQQIIVKSAVCPWTTDLILSDAFRAPLGEVFQLLEIVLNYQQENSSKSLSHLCLHVEAVKTKSDKKLQLPEYNCLVLSPANLWQQNRELFRDDPNLLSTIYNYQNLQKGKISLAEMLFGMSMKDTGIKRYPLRTRQRIVQFAITVVLKEYDAAFLDGLQKKLTSLFPLHQPSNMMPDLTVDPNDTNSTTAAPIISGDKQVTHVYYPGEFNIAELVPLTMTYFVLFLYVYFSVRKIELVKSKIGMAFSAVMTVLASLFMSVGLCFFFGLTLTLNGRDVFPYLVVIVGLENVLVLTKSVVSTPTHLDVKIRVAQGLSREGWSITKNLLTEVTILTIGLLTFVPAIQKFCIFAIVGLLTDFFVQIFFFTTVLAIDIRRMELSSESQHHRIQYSTSSNTALHNPLRQFRSATPVSSYKPLARSKSQPRLNGSGTVTSSNYPTNVVAPYHNSAPILVKLPKRLRLVHFWARTRIFQRAFMLFMVMWITVIVYSSGFVEQLLQVNPDSIVSEKVPNDIGTSGIDHHDLNKIYHAAEKSITKTKEKSDLLEKINMTSLQSLIGDENTSNIHLAYLKSIKSEIDDIASDDLARLRHTGFDPWRRLSNHHWPAILSLYNISTAGRYITILPSIRLSHVVTPDTAKSVRNLEERSAQHFQWQALAVALDPLDFSDGETSKISSQKTFLGSDVPFIPSSPMEIFLTAVLCIISVVVLAYTMVVLYRCVCSRNYAEWRASWAGENEEQRDGVAQVVMEAVPLMLEGHKQEVECLSTDGTVVVSSCLEGQLCVWDSLSGESIITVNRKRYFSSLQNVPSQVPDSRLEDPPLSDYESGSPPSRGEIVADEVYGKSEQVFWNLPDFRSAINTNFTTRSCSVPSENMFRRLNNREGFDYGPKYQELYEEFKSSLYINDNENINRDKSYEENSKLKDTVETHRDNISDRCSPNESQSVQTTGLLQTNFTGYQRDLGGKMSTKTANEMQDCEVGVDVVSLNCGCGSDNLLHCVCDKDCICSLRNNNKKCTCNYSRNPVRKTRKVSHDNTVETTDSAVIYQDVPVPVCSYRATSFENDTESLRNISVSSSSSTPPPLKHKQTWCHVVGSDMTVDENKLCKQEARPLNTHFSSVVESGKTSSSNFVPAIWCLDCHENIIVVGCSSGRIEFWEASTGRFKCLFEDGSGIGITSVKLIGNRVVAAKLSGAVDFLELESYCQGQPTDWGFTSYRRTHVRTNSAGALSDWQSWAAQNVLEDIRCIRLNTTKAHQQPITVLDSEGGRVLTGSQDHTLKVFRLEDQLPLYTLHGHSGPISCLFIDRISPMMSGSGSQDGLLCVWDLLTGACMYSIQAHDGSVITLTYSASYVISLGADERLCVWERFQGHLLNTIQVAHTYCSSMGMLTHNLLITSKQGSLVVWDVRTGVPVRIVKLGHSDKCVFVKQILLVGDSVVCDYSNQLRIVRFPLVSDKCD